MPWPIRNTMALRGFLVYPVTATRRLMLKLEPTLQERAKDTTDEVESEEKDKEEEEEEEEDGEDEAVEEEDDHQVKKQKTGDK